MKVKARMVPGIEVRAEMWISDASLSRDPEME